MHDYYPKYREELETTEPITDLLVAVSLLLPVWNSSEKRYFILNTGPIRHPGRSTYIIHDHFYRRSGEYAGSDMFLISEDLVEMLTKVTIGYPYFGGRDESVRQSYETTEKWWRRSCEEKAEQLHHYLVPGTHGWSSLYTYQHMAYWPIWCVSTSGGWSQAFIPKGVCFKNPINEHWYCTI